MGVLADNQGVGEWVGEWANRNFSDGGYDGKIRGEVGGEALGFIVEQVDELGVPLEQALDTLDVLGNFSQEIFGASDGAQLESFKDSLDGYRQASDLMKTSGELDGGQIHELAVELMIMGKNPDDFRSGNNAEAVPGQDVSAPAAPATTPKSFDI